MSESRLDDYLEHIEQACKEALDFVGRQSFDDFKSDRRTQLAVMMNFVVIGEASVRVMAAYAAFVEAHAEIPWQQMRGMRNRMAHGYFDINFDIVWATLHDAIPPLLVQIQELRKSI